MTPSALSLGEPAKFHHPNCSFGATDGPAGDFCNCSMAVSYTAYAAQRATITQQAQEIAEGDRKLRELCMAYGPALIEIHDLKQQLATMTRERNEAQRRYEKLLQSRCDHDRRTTGDDGAGTGSAQSS